MSEPETTQGVLETAIQLVYGDRAQAYGNGPEETHELAEMTAGVWGSMLGVNIAPRTVPLMLAAMKLCREQFKPKRDNLVDCAGYMHVVDKCDQHEGPVG